MSSERDSVGKVAAELWNCAKRHDPHARLLGNVRSADIVRLCEVYMDNEDQLLEDALVRARDLRIEAKLYPPDDQLNLDASLIEKLAKENARLRSLLPQRES